MDLEKKGRESDIKMKNAGAALEFFSLYKEREEERDLEEVGQSGLLPQFKKKNTVPTCVFSSLIILFV